MLLNEGECIVMKGVRISTYLKPTVTRPVQVLLAVVNLNNRLYIYNIIYFFELMMKIGSSRLEWKRTKLAIDSFSRYVFVNILPLTYRVTNSKKTRHVKPSPCEQSE